MTISLTPKTDLLTGNLKVIGMNGKQILILKEAIDQINDELYKSLPLDNANKAVQIIKTVVGKTIKKYFKLFE